jgi:8-amino-7-oxononanoate synthase
MRPDELAAALTKLDSRHQRRRRVVLTSPQRPLIDIDGRSYLSFASNDYLGLANHPELVLAAADGARHWGVGSGASALVTGHFAAHEEAERALASFVGLPASLLFSSGFAANLAVPCSLLGRGDAVFADRLNHASLNDACLLCRASFQRFRHNDLEHLEQLLRTSRAHTRLIAVDAVYSMDGDEAPLSGLLELARRYDAWLYIDDAHGFGVLGEGRGSLAEHGLHDRRIIYMATLGKAAGVAGAGVAGSAEVVDWLVNSARTYIYSTAHPPMLAYVLTQSLRIMAAEGWRRIRLHEHVAHLRTRLNDIGIMLTPSRTAIQPLIMGDNRRALDMSARLREVGLWVPAIRPPTVPAGTARLRVSLSAAHTPEDIDQLIDEIAGAAR